MKTKKWIVGLLSVSSIGAIAPMVTSCVDKTNSVELLSSTPKEREVGAKAERVYFDFKQTNVSSPQDTKLKLSNLYVNGAAAKPVAGLLQYKCDSGGNVKSWFNFATASSHYGAKSVTFDIEFNNKTAGTCHTVSDFSIKISDNAYNVVYPATTETQGITWTKQPESVGLGEDFEVDFKLETGYKFITEDNACDILVGNTSVKQQIIEAGHKLSKEFWVLSEDEQECWIYVPAEFITDDLTVVLKTQGKEYTVTKTLTNVTTTVPDKIQHGQEWTQEYSLKREDYHTLDTLKVIGDTSGTDLLDNGTAVFDATNKTIKFNTKGITENFTITADANPAKFNITMPATEHLQALTETATWDGRSASKTIKILPAKGYEKTHRAADKLYFSYKDYEHPEQAATRVQLESTDYKGTFVIPADMIQGDITIEPVEDYCDYKIDHDDWSTVTYGVTTDAPSTIKYNPSGKWDWKLAPTKKYWEVTSWNVTRDETTSLKDEGTATLNGETLTVQKSAITGNLHISATATPCSWGVTVNSSCETAESHITAPAEGWGNAKYDDRGGYSATGTINDAGKYYDYELVSAFTHNVETDKDVSIKDYVTITPDSTAKTLKVDISNTAENPTILGPITITLKEKAKGYAVTKTKDGTYKDNIVFTGGGDEAYYSENDTPYETTITTDKAYLEVDSTKVKVLRNGEELERGTGKDYTFDEDTGKVSIKGSVITDVLEIVAEATEKELNVTATGDEHLSFTEPTKAKYNQAYSVTFSLTDGYKLNESSVQCVVTGGKTLTLGEGNGLLLNGNTISIENPEDIVGELTFTAASSQMTVSSTATGFSVKSYTTKYLGECTINLEMTSGYLLNADDFTNKKVVVKSGNDEIDATNLIISASQENPYITIKADAKATGDITITGAITHYSVTVSEPQGQTGVFTTITKSADHAEPDTDFTITLALATGYTNASVSKITSIKDGSPEDITSHCSITDTLITIPGGYITGPVSVEDLTALKTLKWTSFDTQVAAGSESTNAYTAETVITPATSAEVKIKEEIEGVSLDESTKKLSVNSDVPVGTEITLQATLDGAKTLEGVVEVTAAFEVSGDHEMDLEDTTTGLTLTATKSATFEVDSSSTDLIEISESTTTSATVKVKSTAPSTGGVAIVNCTETTSDGNSTPIQFKINVITSSKISFTTSGTVAYAKAPESGVTGNLVIPGTYMDSEGNEYSVEVAAEGFKTDAPNITSLTLGEGITKIGSNAFQDISITELVIPKSCKTISLEAFKASSSSTGTLKTLTFADDCELTSIWQNGFAYQPIEGTLTLPSKLETIYMGAFYGCSKITEVEMTSCKTIWSGAFYGCSELTKVTIPSNCTSLDDSDAFGDCKKLSQIIVESSTIYNKTSNPFSYLYSSGFSSPHIFVKTGTELGENSFLNSWTKAEETAITGYDEYYQS